MRPERAPTQRPTFLASPLAKESGGRRPRRDLELGLFILDIKNRKSGENRQGTLFVVFVLAVVLVSSLRLLLSEIFQLVQD